MWAKGNKRLRHEEKVLINLVSWGLRHSFLIWRLHAALQDQFLAVFQQHVTPLKDAYMKEDDTEQRTLANVTRSGNRPTPMIASHRDRNGVCTVAVNCPAAAIIWPIAERTFGSDVNNSDRAVGLHGSSSDGKSKFSTTECEHVAVEGDGGGET